MGSKSPTTSLPGPRRRQPALASPAVGRCAAATRAPSSAARGAASTLAETDPSPASPATVAAADEVDSQNAAATNTQQWPRARDAEGTIQLPPEILAQGAPPGTCPAGTYGRNRLRLSHMLGNVAERTSRYWGDGLRLVHGGRWSLRHLTTPASFATRIRLEVEQVIT